VSPGKASGIGARVGHLHEVVVPGLVQAQHLLDLGLGLKDEVLRRAAAQDQDARGSAGFLGLVDDRGGLVDVAADVEPGPAVSHPKLGDVHADRRVAGDDV